MIRSVSQWRFIIAMGQLVVNLSRRRISHNLIRVMLTLFTISRHMSEVPLRNVVFLLFFFWYFTVFRVLAHIIGIFLCSTSIHNFGGKIHQDVIFPFSFQETRSIQDWYFLHAYIFEKGIIERPIYAASHCLDWHHHSLINRLFPSV